jgi:CHAT domain-containing protein
MEEPIYSVYNYKDLYEKLNTITDKNEDVVNFFKNFTFDIVVNHNIAKNNSTFVFKNAIKEDINKSKIIQHLNKLHQQNLSKVISSIREIVFQTQEELNELVNQCIQKIKRESSEIRPLVAALCYEFLSLYFVMADGTKIYFRQLLLSEVKKEYIQSIDYENSEWSKEKADKSMILIGTLFNNKIIEPKIMTSIIKDFKKTIEYQENGTQEQYSNVEKSLQQLSCLISLIILNDETKPTFEGLDKFLEEQMIIYDDKKKIQKRVRMICKNTIGELRK